MGADTIRNVERLSVYGSGDEQAPNSYTLATHDMNVDAGKSLMVVGLSLQANETLRFDGSAETDGTVNLRGGRGGDTLTGGAGRDQIYGNLGADLLRGGGGNDSFEYHDRLESTAASRDSILDFSAGDKINLINIDADGTARAGNGRFAWIGGSAFSGTAGELRAARGEDGRWVVAEDIDGDKVADLSIGVETAPTYTLSAADFWL